MPFVRSLVLVLATVSAASPGAGHRRYARKCAGKSSAALSDTAAIMPTLTATNGSIPIASATNSGGMSDASVASVSTPATDTADAASATVTDSVSSVATGLGGGLIGTSGSVSADSSVAATGTASGSVDPATATTTTTGTDPTNGTGAQTLNATSGSPLALAQALERKVVFAHFMVGIVSTYAQADWEKDMKLAQSYGIDGFALNIGVDSYTQQQLDYAYAAAQAVTGFKVFISFDFNWYKVDQVSDVSTMFTRYVNNPAQYLVDGRAFVSTFIGDGFDWATVETNAKHRLYVVPKWEPSATNAENKGVAGLFSWRAWPGQVNNVPVNTSLTTADDLTYLSIAEAQNKVYMAPVSPWFSTHFAVQAYPKNFVFKSETLWVDRWKQIMELSDRLQFLEIVTWNDYGESHYIAPYNTPHTDDGSAIWASGMDHTPLLDIAKPYISAFKAGQKEPTVDTEGLVYWYRPHLKSAECDSTDNCKGKPKGWEFLSDSVFVATMSKAGGSFTVTSGSNAAVTQKVEAGINVFEVPMAVGQQKFEYTPTGGSAMSGAGNVTVSADCWNGVYNFNMAAGKLSA